jgi:hypothetical protein|tara:strand:+ start:425 stop:595 length:171 start_codon:yes stop_codon:yes gene_type:complete
MYLEHQNVIGDWARRSPENLSVVIQFAIVSARVRLLLLGMSNHTPFDHLGRSNRGE